MAEELTAVALQWPWWLLVWADFPHDVTYLGDMVNRHRRFLALYPLCVVDECHKPVVVDSFP